MNNVLYYLKKDIRENIYILLFFILQICICCVFIIMCSIQLIIASNFNNQIKHLRDYNIVNFNVYYGQSGIKNYKTTNDMLSKILDLEEDAYAYVDTITLPQYPNYKVIIGLGNFNKIYKISYDDKTAIKNSDGTIILTGSKIKDIQIGDGIEIGSNEYQVNGRLSSNAAYTKGMTDITLDQCILILTQYSSLNEWYPNYYISDVIASLGLLNPDSTYLESIIDVINNNYIIVSPVYFNSSSEEAYSELIDNTYFFFILFICVLLFTCIGIISNLLLMIEKNYKTYAIHRVYGATLFSLCSRVVFYIACILVIPFIVCIIVIKLYSGLYHIPIPWLIIIFAIITGFLSWLPISNIKKKDMSYFLRRDY